MNKLKSHFKFNKQEQSGIFFLLLVIVVLHLGYSYIKGSQTTEGPTLRLNADTQTQLDQIKAAMAAEDTLRIYPFNPNYITDYKGYTLGMSPAELDRLAAYRDLGKFVNSPKEFQAVTQISDSLLNRISPYFKFPDWVTSQRKKENNVSRPTKEISNKEVIKRDLNAVTANELRAIRGIGNVLSERTIKFRDRLGGFLMDAQLYDVYGLEKEVADRALARFTVLNPPTINKTNINEATAAELAQLVYIQKSVAQRIVAYRNVNGSIDSWEDLIKIKDFPADKIERIKLYLTLKK